MASECGPLPDGQPATRPGRAWVTLPGTIRVSASGKHSTPRLLAGGEETPGCPTGAELQSGSHRDKEAGQSQPGTGTQGSRPVSPRPPRAEPDLRGGPQPVAMPHTRTCLTQGPPQGPGGAPPRPNSHMGSLKSVKTPHLELRKASHSSPPPLRGISPTNTRETHRVHPAHLQSPITRERRINVLMRHRTPGKTNCHSRTHPHLTGRGWGGSKAGC